VSRPNEPNFSYVRTVIRLSEVDSTSDLARRLLERGELPARSLVWADRQTRGRGQGANAWWSDEGSLTATVVIDPDDHGLTVAYGPRVALTVALISIEAIRKRYPSCRPEVRWPNDIEVEGRKLGGLLTEWVETAEGPRILVGIGINVRTRLEAAPPEVRRMAASLAEWEADPPTEDPKASLLQGILGRLQYPLTGLVRDGRGLHQRWNERDALAGSTIRIQVGAEVLEGVAKGIDELGGLRLRVGAESRVIYAGRVLRE